ncbi:hypothetical protein [Paenibacillus thiaminolyticus]|uniref:Uncharacterized protein n=1 Tax=Paenibacillus thiaminolyticus TaxID=49283 RepID=A0A3A3GD24_PANTH|nr:hypothetical protein [Paenibacillus thiaminolyticus]RJG21375.1 hypothetical protein DQX05_22005 [Paenibacillus thiaminolyticus]
MVYILAVISIVLMILYVKEKAKVAYFEGKFYDFKQREQRLLNRIGSLIYAGEENELDSTKMLVGERENGMEASSDLAPCFETLEAAPMPEFSSNFLKALGIKSADIILENQSNAEMPTESVPEDNHLDIDEINLKIDVHESALDKDGYHFWDCQLSSKFSEDLVLLSDGFTQHYLSHLKFHEIDEGDWIKVQIRHKNGKKEVLNLWKLDNEIAI